MCLDRPFPALGTRQEACGPRFDRLHLRNVPSGSRDHRALHRKPALKDLARPETHAEDRTVGRRPKLFESGRDELHG